MRENKNDTVNDAKKLQAYPAQSCRHENW